jgi:hypothetical protein
MGHLEENMKLKSLMVMSVISLATWTFVAQSAQADTKLAIHATQAEVDIWKQRRTSGPYLDEWTRILSRANNFKSNSSKGFWLGNQLNTPWEGDMVRDGKQNPNYYPGGSSSSTNGSRTWAADIRDAGFVYLITGDTSYRDLVRTLLLKQAAASGTDFSNSTKWRTNYINQDKDFQITLWLREMTYAYSYVRSSLSSSDQATIDAFFLKAGKYWDLVVHNSSKKRFPNRYQDDYSNPTGAGEDKGLTHYNGYRTYSFGYSWDNKAAQHNAAVAGIAAMLNDATLLSHAKRFVKEWIKYNTYPDGTVWDQRRWQGDSPQGGWSYAATVIGSNITATDHIARTGDTELYTYQTSEGVYGSAGGPKSLLKILQRLANLTLGKQFAYASTDSSLSSSERIDPDGESPNRIVHYVYDVALAQANVYYKDALLKSSYTRPMDSNPSHGGYDPCGGDWGNLPGARFMFGQMEGKVWLYLTTPRLPPPRNLSMTSME